MGEENSPDEVGQVLPVQLLQKGRLGGVNDEVGVFREGASGQSRVQFQVEKVVSWLEAGAKSRVLLVVLKNTTDILIVSACAAGVVSDQENGSSAPAVPELLLSLFTHHIVLVDTDAVAALLFHRQPVDHSAAPLVELQLLAVVLGALFDL